MVNCVVFDAYGTLFNVFSVESKCEEEFPGNGKEITKVWRQKQLEYSWLQTLMGNYKNFWEITKDALRYSLKLVGVHYDENVMGRIMESYYHLSVYSDVKEALSKFRPAKLVILTNGNDQMFEKLLHETGMNQYLDGFLSADQVQVFKPHRKVYQIVIDKFHMDRKEILFISSNAWDIAGAKSFGFSVGWINRLNRPFEVLGVQPDFIGSSLSEIEEKSRESRSYLC